jgi:endo-1,4-beta-xylanase
MLENDPTYAGILAAEFDQVTPDNAMKFAATEPQQNTYDFRQADKLVQFAQEHHMKIHGHNLVWDQALPDWITNGHFTREQLLNILYNHITTVVSRYRGKVAMWDVVNEALDYNGNPTNSIWERVIGPSYIDSAFIWAHEADPQAQLFYNDYGGEDLGTKSDKVYALVKGLIQRGIPINGVGLQMHIGQPVPNPQDVQKNIARLGALGLKVEITEMDVNVTVPANNLHDAQILNGEAQIYHDELAACLAEPACEGFSMWGFTDLNSWLDGSAPTGQLASPLIFDRTYHPKPAYYALIQALQGR